MGNQSNTPVYGFYCYPFGVGYESHDRAAPGGAAAPKSAAPEIYFSLLEAQRGIIPNFFSLYQLQIVLLTIANKKNISVPEIVIL